MMPRKEGARSWAQVDGAPPADRCLRTRRAPDKRPAGTTRRSAQLDGWIRFLGGSFLHGAPKKKKKKKKAEGPSKVPGT